MNIRRFNPFRILNNVPMGIVMMALIGMYIAVGSGFASVREYFDMTELQFFNAWPLKLLMGLLIANLVVVTWVRIPLTPPRYGVWCVHTGIITLILGTGFYYHRKLEGRVRLFTNPGLGSTSVDHFYDKDERAIYVKVNDTPWNFYPLANLPRFNAYDVDRAPAPILQRAGLQNIVPTLTTRENPKQPSTLSQWLGWKDPVTFDITAYYPYAQINTSFVDDPTIKNTGVRLTLPDLHEDQDMETWAVAADPRFRAISQFGCEFEHRPADATLTQGLLESAGKLFHLTINLSTAAGPYTQTLNVQPGQTVDLGQTGYHLTIENFDPAWNMFGTHESVQALTFNVVTPTQTFRRMVLNGKDIQTDFAVNIVGAPPMGKRQKEPLDKNLAVVFHFDDPYQLLPQSGTAKHTLITPLDSGELIDIAAADNAAMTVTHFASGSGDVQITTDDPQADSPAHPSVRLHLERKDNLRRQDTVEAVPVARRDRNLDEQGAMQVAKVLVHFGSWSQQVIVPFRDEAGDDAPNMQWDGGLVQLPNSNITLQLQLGNTRRSLPAKITLDKFELVPYAGGDANNPRALMRDFRSTITVEDLETGERFTDVAHLNSPVYFREGDWLFFQAAYDGDSRTWTQLGIGNRPGVRIMILGCILIFTGLAYAFYAKPVIIQRMKQRALAESARRKQETVYV